MLRSPRYTKGTSFTEKLMCHDWPMPPIWPEDLPLIRQLLTDEEYAELLRRIVQILPNGLLLDYRQAFGEPSRT